IGLGRIDVALGIDRDAVHAEELAGLAAAAAERGQFGQSVALDDAYALVLAVGDVYEALLGILGERDLPGRTRRQRVLGKELFLYEGAAGVEHLHAIMLPVADVKQAVVRQRHAVHRAAELLQGGRGRIVGSLRVVIGLVAVGAPEALDLAGIGIHHRDAPV